MLDFSLLEKIDSQLMHQIYDKWPEIASESYDSKLDACDYIGIDHVVFAGMGGSGALGDIFSSILSKTKIHVTVVKGYLLPKTVDSNTLVVTTSVSGNTAETLSVLNNASQMDCKIIAFSSGGKMEKYCDSKKLEFRKISLVHSPRASFTAYLYSMLKVLEGILPVEKNDVSESIIQLKQLRNKISSSNLSEENSALALARWIKGIPIIYYPWGLQAAAIRYKNSLQENAKIHAMAEDVVEACHNGIVAWERKSTIQPILIEGEDDYAKTKERWNIVKNYFKDNNIDFWEIKSIKGGILAKLIQLIYLLDYSSIYLGCLNNVNPSPINSIEYIKKRL